MLQTNQESGTMRHFYLVDSINDNNVYYVWISDDNTIFCSIDICNKFSNMEIHETV